MTNLTLAAGAPIGCQGNSGTEERSFYQVATLMYVDVAIPFANSPQDLVDRLTCAARGGHSCGKTAWAACQLGERQDGCLCQSSTNCRTLRQLGSLRCELRG